MLQRTIQTSGRFHPTASSVRRPPATVSLVLGTTEGGGCGTGREEGRGGGRREEGEGGDGPTRARALPPRRPHSSHRRRSPAAATRFSSVFASARFAPTMSPPRATPSEPPRRRPLSRAPSRALPLSLLLFVELPLLPPLLC